jgi:hypothetical protein
VVGEEKGRVRYNEEEVTRMECKIKARGAGRGERQEIGSHIAPGHGRSGGQVGSRTTSPGTAPAPRWCPPGLTKTQRRRVQMLRAKEIEERKMEAESDAWFSQERPMNTPKKTWKEKQIEREDRSGASDSEPGSNENSAKVDINMVFQLPVEFGLPAAEMARLDLGVERDVFQKPDKLGQHTKPLYIKGYLGIWMASMLTACWLMGGLCQYHAMHHV